MEPREFLYRPDERLMSDNHDVTVLSRLTGGVVSPSANIKQLIYAVAVAQMGAVSSYQLKYLGTFVNTRSEYNSRTNALYRQRKKNLLSNRNGETSRNGAFVYSSTTNLEKYLDTNVANLGVFDKNELEIFDRRKLPSGQNLAHFLATNDIRLFLLGYESHPTFHFQQEYNLTLRENVEDKKAGSTPVRPDGAIVYRMSSPDICSKPSRIRCHTHFLEADSGKQKATVITEKMSKYITYLVELKTVVASLYSIDFCIFANSDEYISIGRMDNRRSALANSMAYRNLQTLSAVLKETDLIALHTEVSNIDTTGYRLFDIVESVGMLKRDFDSAVNFLRKILDNYSELHCMADIVERDAKSEVGNAEDVLDFLNKRYLARRKVIFEAALEAEDIRISLLKGLHLTALPNHDFYSTYPFVYVRACNMDEYIFNYYKKSFGASELVSYDRYALLYPKDDKDNPYQVLHNQYTTDASVYCVENIVADLGGRYRARSYFQRKENLFKVSERVICLVSEPKEAFAFAMECAADDIITCYEDYLTTRHCKLNVRDAINSGKVNLPLFLTYKDLQLNMHEGKLGNGLFVLDRIEHCTYII